MARKKLPYQEGDWFAVPLRDGGYALGLVARMDNEGGVLGYFFGPKRHTLPTNNDVIALCATDAVLIRLCGDLGLLQGDWPIVGRVNQWTRPEWPVPEFGRIALDESWATRVEYDDQDLSYVGETPVTVEEARRLPEDGLSGYGAIEIRLTDLLSLTPK